MLGTHVEAALLAARGNDRNRSGAQRQPAAGAGRATQTSAQRPAVLAAAARRNNQSRSR